VAGAWGAGEADGAFKQLPRRIVGQQVGGCGGGSDLAGRRARARRLPNPTTDALLAKNKTVFLRLRSVCLGADCSRFIEKRVPHAACLFQRGRRRPRGLVCGGLLCRLLWTWRSHRHGSKGRALPHFVFLLACGRRLLVPSVVGAVLLEGSIVRCISRLLCTWRHRHGSKGRVLHRALPHFMLVAC